MAGITISAANVDKFVPRVVQEGVFAQTFRFDFNGVTLSISDVVVIGYIQQGVQVLSGYAWGGSTDGASTFKFGVGSNDTALSTAIAVAATGTTALAGFTPKSFSLSADAEGNLKLQVIATKTTGSITATGSINLTLLMQALPL